MQMDEFAPLPEFREGQGVIRAASTLDRIEYARVIKL